MDPKDSGEDLAETRRSIIDSADQLERWTQALLSYLHPLEPKRRRVRMSHVVDSAANLLKHELETRDLTLERHGFADDPACDLDPDLMEQAIYGLLNNAAEASPRGAAIALNLSPDQRRGVVLTIEDRGPGIGFTPSSTGLSPGPTTKPHGTGLGIPFALKVIQAHGGDIEFQTGQHGGTRVRIVISTMNEHEHAAD